jgi:hypothetical protein
MGGMLTNMWEVGSEKFWGRGGKKFPISEIKKSRG